MTTYATGYSPGAYIALINSIKIQHLLSKSFVEFFTVVAIKQNYFKYICLASVNNV